MQKGVRFRTPFLFLSSPRAAVTDNIADSGEKDCRAVCRQRSGIRKDRSGCIIHTSVWNSATQPAIFCSNPAISAKHRAGGFILILAGIKVIVMPMRRKQFFVLSLLNDFAVPHHQNQVRAANGGKPVRNDQ